MPSYPESIKDDLKSVRPTFNLRWNAKAKLVTPGEYDAQGGIKKDPVYDGRWELWDIDCEGQEYLVCVLQNPDGSFRPVDQRLVELVRFVDPNRWGGDPGKMLKALVDEPNQKIADAAGREADDLIEMASKWYAYAYTPKSFGGL